MSLRSFFRGVRKRLKGKWGKIFAGVGMIIVGAVGSIAGGAGAVGIVGGVATIATAFAK